MKTTFIFSTLSSRFIAVTLFGFVTIQSDFAQGTFQPAPSGAFVVPPSLENVEGEQRGGLVPVIQQALTPAAFPILPSTGVFLTGMSYRQDLASGPGLVVFNDFQIALSTNPSGAQDRVSL